MAIKPILYTASWKPHNLHLKEKEPEPAGESTLLERIWQAVSDVIFYGPKRCMAWLKPACQFLVLPSSKMYSDENNASFHTQWKEKWETSQLPFVPIPLEVTTPDGAIIQGIFYKNNATNSNNIPTIINFNTNGNVCKQETHNWLLNSVGRRVAHVVAFDYRGAGESVGIPNSDRLILDGDSVYQCLSDHLKIPEKHIHIFGRSLGGAVGTEVAALHPEGGRVVNALSFTNLDDMVDKGGMVQPTKLHSPLFWETLMYPLVYVWDKIIKVFAKWLLAQFSWKFDAHAALMKIKERILVVYHPKDDLIAEAGMTYATDKSVEKLELQESAAWKWGNYHNIDFEYCTDKATGEAASAKICQFLLPPFDATPPIAGDCAIT